MPTNTDSQTTEISHKVPEDLKPELDAYVQTGEALGCKIRDRVANELTSPAFRLCHCLSKIEDIAALLHVLYRSSLMEDDVTHDEIINKGLAEYGDSALVALINEEVKSLYEELKDIAKAIRA
ncbi:hypothetical protein [Pseudanabaena sp. PCC 6802]|uniref:hypothetical protein n=1 Tax=Pseudanabaena sp. PCC 6802 TaxID=118173 RepID=UPI00034B547F|nr:hypothetical protein [Pseudanabaena sp. PCC 6802]